MCQLLMFSCFKREMAISLHKLFKLPQFVSGKKKKKKKVNSKFLEVACKAA